MNRKYLFGIAGLVLGIVVGFTWTRSYNNNNAQPLASSAGAAGSGAQPTGGSSSTDQKAMMGDVAKTIDDAKKNPQNFDAQMQAATVYYQIGKLEETAHYLEAAYAVDPKKLASVGGLPFIGKSYFDKQSYTEAEKWFRLALESETNAENKAEMHVMLGEIYMKREPVQPDKAVTEIQEAIKLDARNVHAVGHLVEAYALKKDAKSAEAALSQLKTIEPQNQRIQALEAMLADLKAGRPITLPKE